MANELRNKIATRIYENMLVSMHTARRLAEVIIDDVGLKETDASRHNEMVKYETSWLTRNGESDESDDHV